MKNETKANKKKIKQLLKLKDDEERVITDHVRKAFVKSKNKKGGT